MPIHLGSWLEFVLCSVTHYVGEGFCIAAINEVLRTDFTLLPSIATAGGLLRSIQHIVLGTRFHDDKAAGSEKSTFLQVFTTLQGMEGILNDIASSPSNLADVWRNAVFPQRLKKAASPRHKLGMSQLLPDIKSCSQLLSYQASCATKILDASSHGVYKGNLDPFLDLMAVVDALRESTKMVDSVCSVCTRNEMITTVSQLFQIFQSLGCAQVEDNLLLSASSTLFFESRLLDPPLANVSHLRWNRGDSTASGRRAKKGRARKSIFTDFSDNSSDDEDPNQYAEPSETINSGDDRDSDTSHKAWSVYGTSCYSLCGADAAIVSTSSNIEPRWACSPWVLQWSSAKQVVALFGSSRSPTSLKSARTEKIRWQAMRANLFSFRLQLLSTMVTLSSRFFDSYNETILSQVLSSGRQTLGKYDINYVFTSSLN